MIYFDYNINAVDIIINLLIVILTTGITYYLFSVLPSKRRLKTLKLRLINFKNELKETILDSEKEFKTSYEFYEEKIPSKENEVEFEIWSLIKFLSHF